MMKEEFEDIIQRTISNEDYAVVEQVYAFHPSISETTGKAEIAAIYNLPGGMRVIRDMVPTAEKARDIEDCMIATKQRIREQEDLKAELIQQMERLRH